MLVLSALCLRKSVRSPSNLIIGEFNFLLMGPIITVLLMDCFNDLSSLFLLICLILIPAVSHPICPLFLHYSPSGATSLNDLLTALLYLVFVCVSCFTNTWIGGELGLWCQFSATFALISMKVNSYLYISIQLPA